MVKPKYHQLRLRYREQRLSRDDILHKVIPALVECCEVVIRDVFQHYPSVQYEKLIHSEDSLMEAVDSLGYRLNRPLRWTEGTIFQHERQQRLEDLETDDFNMIRGIVYKHRTI